MAKRKPALGKSLDALLSGSARNQDGAAEDELRMVPLHKISRGEYQPRLQMDPESLEELADSIKAQGLVQPVVLRETPDGYELIAGERRWRASQIAGLQELPAIIKDIPDQAAAAMSLIENIQRENLNPFEESTALRRLITEFDLTHQQVADAVGRSRTAVTNILRLLDLHPKALEFLEMRRLEMGHARALLSLDSELQPEAARYVADKELSVRETERYVKALKNRQLPKPDKISRSHDVIRLEQDLSERLGATVALQYNSKGKGKLVINYNNLDELDGILAHIK